MRLGAAGLAVPMLAACGTPAPQAPAVPAVDEARAVAEARSMIPAEEAGAAAGMPASSPASKDTDKS